MDEAWIDMKPVCSECGQILDYAVVREDTLKHEQGFLYKQYAVRPERCPKCGRWFCGVRIKEVQERGV